MLIRCPLCLYRGRIESLHQFQCTGVAEGNETGATHETDAGHTQLHGSDIRKNTARPMDQFAVRLTQIHAN